MRTPTTVRTTVISCMLLMALNTTSQQKYYLPNGEKKKGQREVISLEFGPGLNNPLAPQDDGAGELGALAASLIPGLIDAGYKLTTSLIEGNAKKYAAEYSARNSYLDKKTIIPSVTVLRAYGPAGSQTTGLKLELKPEITGDENGFVYYVHKVDFQNTKAKTKKGKNTMDLGFEVQVTYFNEKDGKKETQTSQVMVVPGIEVGSTEQPTTKAYRTDRFPLGEKLQIAEVSVKVTETNQHKVNVDKVKELWDKHQEDVKKVVDNIVQIYLPEEKEEAPAAEGGDAGNAGANANAPQP